ncbi:hypothetical protein L0B53_01740 [Vibrio sp. SS-MA-C1-2]|uniref:hypothetical protein n=1 Tax=Vibrio sp. SS-MA-C1-2 TaxID=2908646 RepID=UPI001F411B9B|nr:hypothetical protein [Vibrio sp. SS-MA-C1-2]UJF17518.1 hypothetical protein L0B53_01740 [Vibrio sp. SS-MA-C1-2]
MSKFKRFILCLVAMLMVGCADRANDNLGSESVVYRENHQFTITFKTSRHQFEQKKIIAIGQQFEETIVDLSITYHPKDKMLAKQLKALLADQGIEPKRIILKRDDRLTDKMAIDVVQWRVKVEVCKPYVLGNDMPNIGCSVDANRTISVRNPANLVR